MQELALLGGDPVRKTPFPKWPLATEQERGRLRAVVDSNGWGIFRGNETFEFGRRFAKYHGAKYGIACANGTVALQVQLQAQKIGRGDEVITTVNTFISTVSAITSVGAIPVYVDIKADDYCMDPKKIESKITKKTRAIIAVHLYNALCDLDKISRIARKYDLALIEDAAQVPGSFYRGRGVGTIGQSGSFSFQESKIMTSGEGGMITTNSRELSEVMHSYINCGRSRSGDRTKRAVMGTNLRMTDFQAAVLLGQLDLLKSRTVQRERSVRYLNRRLAKISGIEVMSRSKKVTKQACYCYIFKIKPEVLGIDRELFIKALEAEGIPTRKLFVPVYCDPLYHLNEHDTPEAWEYYRKHPVKDSDYPNALDAGYKEGVGIWHPYLLLRQQDLDQLVAAIRKVINNVAALRKLKK